ncbi:MAG: carboxypeptidase-like regulatory domain-containing protein [Prevotella sp.]|nr:carboxypeptidase-like regulatory domain-containing protein [Prevotella sp.]
MFTLFIKTNKLIGLAIYAIVSLLTFSFSASAQTTIKGHVVNERGENIEYVNIGIEEDSVGVISDANGHFTLTIPAGRKDDLSFTHVSYQSAKIPYQTYATNNPLTVTLHDKVVALTEVVVGKKNAPRTLSGKSWVTIGVVAFQGKYKGDAEWGPIFQNRKDYLLTDILLSINSCTYEECMLSFNVYELQGKQFVNIMNKPIYKKITPADDGTQFSVSPEESILLKGKKKYCICVGVVDTKGEGGIFFPANYKSSYARNAVKGKMRKLPICPSIVVKGCEI